MTTQGPIIIQKDLLDILGILIPIILTVLIIVQNNNYEKNNQKLQKQIHNRDIINRFHDDVLRIYNTYYDFTYTVRVSGFEENMRTGNGGWVNNYIGNIYNLKERVVSNKNLARLLFEAKNKDLYNIVSERNNLAIDILDKYINYYASGEFFRISENAWDVSINQGINNNGSYNPVQYKYNYQWLMQDQKRYDNYLRLCKSDTVIEIDRLIDDYMKMHTFEKYDKYFEQYFSLESLQVS